MSLQSNMLDSIATIFRPSSVSRDTHQGVVQNFTVLQAAIPCSQQKSSPSKQLLYNQQNALISSTLYFAEDPGTTANDYISATDDATQTTTYYLVQGTAVAIARGVLWIVDCLEVQATQVPATVVLPTVDSVTTTTAALGGDVTSDGGSTLSAVGVVISQTAVNNYPTLGGTGVTSLPATAAVGTFTVNASGLVPNTTYSFAPYATTPIGTTYGTVTEFTTAAS